MRIIPHKTQNRQALINRLRRRVQSATYKRPSEAIADSMIRARYVELQAATDGSESEEAAIALADAWILKLKNGGTE